MDFLPSSLTLKYLLIPFLSLIFGVEGPSPEKKQMGDPLGHIVMVFKSSDKQIETLTQCRDVILKRLELYGLKGQNLEIRPETGELLLQVPPAGSREVIVPLCTQIGHLRMEAIHSESDCERFNIIFRENYPERMAGLNLLVQYPIRLQLPDQVDQASIDQSLRTLQEQGQLPRETKLRPRLFDKEGFKKRHVREYYWLNGDSFSLGDSLQNLQWQIDETGTHEIELEILDEKDSAMAAFTEKHLDTYIALLLDEHVWITPKVLSVIEDGKIIIHYLDDLNFEGLLLLEALLEGGTLPLRLEFTQEYVKH